tara:strand:- start:377 stop:1348 length:972 start_codon:yes stop_codon:yes gene_type:complete
MTYKNTYKKVPKKFQEFVCEKCDYTTSRESQYKRHILTAKHQILTNTYTKVPEKVPKNPKPLLTIICECGREYKHRQSLNNHRKKCNYLELQQQMLNEKEKEIEEKENNELVQKTQSTEDKLFEVIHNKDEIINNLITEIKDTHKTMKEMIPKIGNTTNNMINNNFNLNMFLNEECKDALNITDFINSLQIQMEDLVNTGKIGFAESTSNLLIKGLNELDVNKRPIHCSDLKRETLYIKDNDVWEKETESKEMMTRAVKHLQKESFGVIPDWVKEHPGCARGDNENNDLYMEIVGNTAGVDKVKDVNKIIKKVAKEVMIDKKK